MLKFKRSRVLLTFVELDLIQLLLSLQMQHPGNKNELTLLAPGPQSSAIFSQCMVNGVKWVCQRLDDGRVNQNSGVMIEAIDKTYYGVLLDVCVLKYPQSLHVVVFKCRWCCGVKRSISW